MYVANLAAKTPNSKVTPPGITSTSSSEVASSGINSTPNSKVTPPGITSTSSFEVASSGITSTPSSEVASSGITSSVASTKMSTTGSRPTTYTIPPSSSICKDCKSENSFKNFYVHESFQSSKTQLLSNHKSNDFTNHINHKYREIELQIEKTNDQISTVVNFIINHRNIICTLEQKIRVCKFQISCYRAPNSNRRPVTWRSTIHWLPLPSLVILHTPDYRPLPLLKPIFQRIVPM